MSSTRQWHLRAEMLLPPMWWDKPHWRERDGETIVLLHGLMRGHRAMEPLARHLSAQGFSTLNVPYPSVTQPVEALVGHIRRAVEKIATDRPVHFLTHSMGGILARLILAEPAAWHPGRLLMLAPPSSGSEIVDRLGRHRFFARCLGPAGRALRSDGLPTTLPALPANLEAAVIMGRRSSLPFFRHLLEKENDGIVSVSRGAFPGLKGFSVVDADHTFIPLHPEVWRRSALFLKSGEWEQS